MHLIQDAVSISNFLWFLYSKWIPHHEINKPFLSCSLIIVGKTYLCCVLSCIIALIERLSSARTPLHKVKSLLTPGHFLRWRYTSFVYTCPSSNKSGTKVCNSFDLL